MTVLYEEGVRAMLSQECIDEVEAATSLALHETELAARFDFVNLGINPTSTQVGGDHYTKLAIQPMRYSMENKLDALQHTAIKYITRFRDKDGVKDLEKAKHCIDMLIQFERTGSLA